MGLVKNLLGILGLWPRTPPQLKSATFKRTSGDNSRKSIRLSPEIDDMVASGLAKQSPNKHWTVAFWDPGPDASAKRRSDVHLRYNATGRIVAAVNDLRRPFEVAVSNTGVFAVNDAGSSSDLSANLVAIGTSGKRLYQRGYKANLAGFSISPCGRYLASQTCNASNEDGFILEIHDIAQQRVLASCTPAAGWSDEYEFETENGELKRVFAKVRGLGKFAYSPTGEFLDAKKFMTARLTKGDFGTRIRAAKELVSADNSEHALQRAMKVVDGAIGTLSPDSDWLASGHRLRGELLEKMNRPAEAIVAYRTALSLNPKIGVKKRLATLEKANTAVSSQPKKAK